MDKEKVAEYLRRLANTPSFPSGYFDLVVEDGVYLIGATAKNDRTKCLIGYKSYYESIVDLSKKIRISYSSAEANQLLFSDEYNPFDAPDEQEFFGAYFAENAAIRISVLWDILGQLYNLKFRCEYREEDLKYKRIFHNKAQEGETFAIRVYEYIKEDDETSAGDTEIWKGNHKFLTSYRNSFSHRSSPNLTSFTATTQNLKPPVSYVFKRILEDYNVVSVFLIELLHLVHGEYFKSNDDS